MGGNTSPATLASLISTDIIATPTTAMSLEAETFLLDSITAFGSPGEMSSMASTTMMTMTKSSDYDPMEVHSSSFSGSIIDPSTTIEHASTMQEVKNPSPREVVDFLHRQHLHQIYSYTNRGPTIEQVDNYVTSSCFIDGID